MSETANSTGRNILFVWLLLITLALNLAAPLGIMTLMVAVPEHEGIVLYWLQALPEFYGNPGVTAALLFCEVFMLYLADRRWKRIPVILVMLLHLLTVGSLIGLWANREFPYAVYHIESGALNGVVYQLAQFEPQNSDPRGYVLYECDAIGLICSDVFYYFSDLPRVDARLHVDPADNTVSIQLYIDLVYTYQPPALYRQKNSP